jgi:hypothetical protein
MNINQPTEFFERLKDWYKKKSYSKVSLTINELDVKAQEQDDYTVLYELIFESKSLEQGLVEIWITVDGYIGIGFERDCRISKRLGLRKNSYSNVFAGGIEPICINIETVIIFLELISDGKVFISVFKNHFFCFFDKGFQIVLPNEIENAERLKVELPFIKLKPPEEPSLLRKYLTYKPWT